MWMMAAALVGSAISTAMSAKGAADQGVSAQNAMNARATAAMRDAMEETSQASEVQLQAQEEEEIRMQKLQSMLGASAVAAAGSGLTSDSGSVEAIAQRNIDITGLDIANTRYMGSSKAANLLRQAGYAREAGASYVRAGEDARSAANLAMWGSIARGVGSMALYGSIPGLGGAPTPAGGGQMFGPPAPGAQA